MAEDLSEFEEAVDGLSNMASWLRRQFVETPDKSTAREMAVAYAQVVTALFNIKAAKALPENQEPDREQEVEVGLPKRDEKRDRQKDGPDWEMEP